MAQRMTTAQMFEALNKRFDSFEERIAKLEKGGTTTTSKKSGNGKKSKTSSDKPMAYEDYKAMAKRIGATSPKTGRVYSFCKDFANAVAKGAMTEAEAKKKCAAALKAQDWYKK